ncbi:hypothetical protein EMIT0347P_20555 [Pseudomonas sp. IT-347P]
MKTQEQAKYLELKTTITLRIKNEVLERTRWKLIL